MNWRNKYILAIGLYWSFLITILGQTPFSAEVTYAGESEPGTVVLNVTSYGRGKAALQKAEKMAFETILFRGVPGSSQTQPLVQNETQARQEHARYFEDLLTNEHYRSFLMQAEPIARASHKAGQKRMSVKIKINIVALRQHMEQQGVIQKFGF
ncbi:hypothetical protein QNI19_27395 [Cytophagaceae bacterium DM2B3-1]|uniref:Uncharacterized protein n=1 Tax=Xanthocytophaga flava TaxID=3048013 RepID=A0ABT7CVR5_9BACT|nr:hypothetical protein [Xanthocytophaga flavus]MDJ1471464.1 hypothetical protein [Xanthocytophaga flavus]MDJ1496689.1 hypothetical protein [Xanthocytophaga flavus]